jgi:RNA recognition motif-containing protein
MVLTSWLCVSGIPQGYDEQRLRDLCGEFGTVRHAEIAMDRERRPLEFGFVEMVRPTDAQRVRDALDGRALAGRTLTVVLVKEPWHGGW